MSSSNELEDSNDSKTTFIDKLLGEMKSEFNKKSKFDEQEDDLISTPDLTPPKINPETDEAKESNSEVETPPNIIKQEVLKASDSSASSEPKSPSKQTTGKGVVKSTAKPKTNTDSESSIKEENSPDSSVESETKPRIVLTFRTEKSKSTVTSNLADKDNSIEESLSPGRRSLRNKANSSEEKEKKTEMECGLKRSARRRSKDCMESILQSAIARKVKSYNETARPQRLTRKLKPTAKILANLEMCQKTQAVKNDKQTDKSKSSNTAKTSPSIDRQKFSYDKLEKGSEQAIIKSEIDYSKHDEPATKMSEQLHRKFKRKHKHKVSKPSPKKTKPIKTEGKESDSENSSFSNHELEDTEDKSPKSELSKSPRKSSSDTDSIKPFRRSHRKLGRTSNVEDNTELCEPMSGAMADEESLVPSHPECSLVACESSVKKCLCQQTSQIYIITSSDLVYCTAVDSVSNKVIGCNNIVSGDIAMLRPSTRIPYIILCEVHKQRLLRHNCCPTCGLFCTQGRFVQCPANHQYHRDCQIVIGEQKFCPHCGIQSPNNDVEILMKCLRKPVFLPTQKAHYPSAKMSFHSKGDKVEEKRPFSPPLIPVDALDLIKVDISQIEDKLSLTSLFEAVKSNDCERVAIILGNADLDLNETIPGSTDGATILHVASQEGLLAIVHMMLVAGAEQDVLDKEQNTPLMLAIQAYKNNVVKYLIKSGASLDLKGTDGMSALHLSAKFGNLEACAFLLSSTQNRRTYINCIDDGGWTPLVWACEHGHLDVTRYLIQNGADPFLRDVEQNVALHWAAFSGSSQITEILLNNGCEVNSVNAHGDSPLHVAARQNKYNCVLMLLARGANVHLVNKSEERPLDCCVAKPGDCYTAISLNVHLQAITDNFTARKPTILTNDISRGKEINPVQCINTVDDESKPTDFVYVTENCITSDINVDRKITTLQCCNCEDRCTSSECLCSNNSLRCWYSDEGKLSSDFNYADPPMLFECNPMCSCNAITCNNRVVQHGLTQRFQLFRTGGKGWGIRTLRMIPRGTYVCEYVGEIISDLEADQREDDSYLFDLDNRDGETYCIDARRYGNLSRFINHSCAPNLLPVRIYIDHQDLRFPRIAFFANRDIQADEELGFDYGEKFWIIKYKSFTCTCGYEMCRYSELTIKTTLENYQRRLLEEQEPVQEVN